jgi:hypothetical protein
VARIIGDASDADPGKKYSPGEEMEGREGTMSMSDTLIIGDPELGEESERTEEGRDGRGSLSEKACFVNVFGKMKDPGSVPELSIIMQTPSGVGGKPGQKTGPGIGGATNKRG